MSDQIRKSAGGLVISSLTLLLGIAGAPTVHALDVPADAATAKEIGGAAVDKAKAVMGEEKSTEAAPSASSEPNTGEATPPAASKPVSKKSHGKRHHRRKRHHHAK